MFSTHLAHTRQIKLCWSVGACLQAIPPSHSIKKIACKQAPTQATIDK